MAPYTIRRECYPLRSCLVDSFQCSGYFYRSGGLVDADTQCIVVGERGGQRAEKIFYVLFFSCLAIGFEFYFTV